MLNSLAFTLPVCEIAVSLSWSSDNRYLAVSQIVVGSDPRPRT